VEYANNRLSGGLWISLGGFGGYVIGMFDFPVENDGGYNISITGNAVKGSSEPGIGNMYLRTNRITIKIKSSDINL
jgi:hypothetical protein